MRFAFDATALPPAARGFPAGAPGEGSSPVRRDDGPAVHVTDVPTGAARYIIRLVQALCALPIDGRLFVFTKTDDVDRFGPWPAHAEPVPIHLPSRPARLAWEQLRLPAWLQRLDIDLLHSPHYTMPLGPVPAARVVTLHDMGFFLRPGQLPRVKRLFFRAMIRAAARRADMVFTDSESTRTDACRLLGLARERTTVVHAAADEHFRPVREPARLAEVEAKYGLRHPFILAVGTLEPRKNLGAAVRTLATLRAGGLDAQLAIVGARGWGGDVLRDEIRRHGMVDHVRLPGFVPDDDLPALYSACDVFLYPSVYEGFGFPPLEAMACGAPVIVANRSSLPEVVADGGLQYDPDNESTLAPLVSTLIRDRTARQQWQQRAVERAACFSWARTARKTYDSYRSVLARKRG
jgi:glycosyltransferase involved in cell wall biosynthesis